MATLNLSSLENLTSIDSCTLKGCIIEQENKSSLMVLCVDLIIPCDTRNILDEKKKSKLKHAAKYLLSVAKQL